MALKLDGAGYTYVTAANASYPGGSFKNASAPGASDGTPVEKQWLNDWLGFFSALMVEAGLAYSGAPDTATVSQYLQAIHAIIAASNVHQVDGFHASQTPVLGQIPVLNANDQIYLDGTGTISLARDNGGYMVRTSTGANKSVIRRALDNKLIVGDDVDTDIYLNSLAKIVHTGSYVNSFGASGYVKHPNGLIVQWGQDSSARSYSSGSSVSAAITFPITFPTACLQVLTSVATPDSGGGTVGVMNKAASGFTMRYTTWSSNTQTHTGSYLAIGY